MANNILSLKKSFNVETINFTVKKKNKSKNDIVFIEFVSSCERRTGVAKPGLNVTFVRPWDAGRR